MGELIATIYVVFIVIACIVGAIMINDLYK